MKRSPAALAAATAASMAAAEGSTAAFAEAGGAGAGAAAAAEGLLGCRARSCAAGERLGGAEAQGGGGLADKGSTATCEAMEAWPPSVAPAPAERTEAMAACCEAANSTPAPAPPGEAEERAAALMSSSSSKMAWREPLSRATVSRAAARALARMRAVAAGPRALLSVVAPLGRGWRGPAYLGEEEALGPAPAPAAGEGRRGTRRTPGSSGAAAEGKRAGERALPALERKAGAVGLRASPLPPAGAPLRCVLPPCAKE